MNTQHRDIFLSCIVPVLNSEHSIRQSGIQLISFLNGEAFNYEIIFVDDCSSDHSTDQIIQIAEEYPDVVKYVFLSTNKGQHFATLTGMHFAHGQFVVTLDDDSQYQPEDISKLLHLNEQHQDAVCYGIPEKKKGISRIRIAFTVLITIFNLLFRNKKTKVSSFRCMKQQIARQIESSALRYVNIEQIIFRNKMNQVSIPVKHFQSIRGSSRYTLMRLLRFVMISLINYTYIVHRLILIATIILIMIAFLFLHTVIGILTVGCISFISLLYLYLIKKKYSGKVEINLHILSTNCYDR